MLLVLPGCALLDGGGGDRHAFPPGMATLRFESGGVAQTAHPDPSDPYLRTLRETYGLDAVVVDAQTDLDRVRALSRWVRTRWEHNGEAVPVRSDPVSILVEAAAGRRFRCVEYAIVLAGALRSVGIEARVVGLKRADVETRPSGAGHVVAEAYLRDRRRWVMVDGQWDALVTRDGEPLSAVEVQQALVERVPGLAVESRSGTSAGTYYRWIAPYLYYFDVATDARVSPGVATSAVMLVPLGAPSPTVFQRTGTIRAAYTHRLGDLYSPPR